MKKISVVLAFLLSCFFAVAQEVIIDCGNPVLQEYYSKHQHKVQQKLSSNLELPFFDDFSNSLIYPDAAKWTDRFAYINNSNGKNPISIGVATLDAIDETGKVYLHLPTGMSAEADYLTSQPLNLQRDVADSIYLSFFYQCGGGGNTPEYRDSLVLQFYSVENDTWKSIWRAYGGNAMENFEMVLIPIIDTIWLKDGFRFRFVNHASLSSNYEPSWQSNVDQWHLDFVILDANRSCNDTIVQDVAMLKNVGPFLKEYTTMPWEHFKQLDRSAVLDSITFAYLNYQPFTNNINRQYNVFDKDENTSLIPHRTYIDNHCGDDSENAGEQETVIYTKKFCYLFDEETYMQDDSATFLIRANIKTDIAQEREYYRQNDTVRYYQVFKNYYAYDDGTAEKGYGISGQGTANSSLAYQFKCLAADTLYGMYIYFNRTQNDGNQKYFYLTVWQDDNGQPGDTIASRMGVLPKYSDNINGFTYYTFDKPIPLAKDQIFYVGWIKTTNDMLNCGLDTDTNARDKIFFNVSGYWERSIVSAALMIRPVFGYELASDIAKIPNFEKQTADFNIFPNPAVDFINIDAEMPIESIEIYDNLGRIVKKEQQVTNISISELPQGVYFVKPKSQNRTYTPQQLIIIR